MGKVEKLLNKLSDENIEEILDALEELEKIKDPDSVSQIELLSKHENDRVRTRVALCLGRIGDINAGETILQLSSDEDAAVRIEAVVALGKFGESGYEEALPKLESMLEENNYRVRKYAIKSIGRCGERSTIDKLVEIFEKNETSLESKELITQAIGNIGGSYAMKILKSWIIEGSMEVRREALNAIGSMANEAAIDLLISIMENKQESKIIKGYAKAALQNIISESKRKYMELKKRIGKYI